MRGIKKQEKMYILVFQENSDYAKNGANESFLYHKCGKQVILGPKINTSKTFSKSVREVREIIPYGRH